MYWQKQAAELDLSAEVATRLSLVDRETAAVSLPDTYTLYTAHTRHSDEDIPKLTKVRLHVSDTWIYSHSVSIQFISLHFLCF